ARHPGARGDPPGCRGDRPPGHGRLPRAGEAAPARARPGGGRCGRPRSGTGPGELDRGGVMTRVLLVDDQALVRSGFSLILSVEDDIEVVGEAGDGAAAIELTRQLRPDIVLMDVQMPVMDGIEATRRIVAEDLATVLVLTTFDHDEYVFDGLAAGASGFLLKNSDPEHLVEAVRTVAAGHALLAPQITRRVIEQMVAGEQAAGQERDGARGGDGGEAPRTLPGADGHRGE